ncbi:23S rRNA (adenine(2503)-C(2))-methyltransferase RlmN [Caldibacillus debilis]|jgi:23S rRNA (adenine2503-C2)-methyltransferase|uniref:Probable dual-specificity RNA methyltransferase RlmN n=1 Tax=Caldibacillus debilis GB1 TaxID=1339248 RepID=A0A420VFQ3_9BACI|nr:23S rRNA (adenine(2503)-C(2))-methyltransferase RlmN [Caldibacillus debilis]MBO2482414.1 23S rRNA (adenine(2503)-C(2))-methyltransferase RlmN [Bacillaceae bacterium]RKO62350.1 23S rRNA m(2)A-2503 methyltransferase [Caldibacillus debilis GB1]
MGTFGVKPSIYGLTIDELAGWLTERGQKKFRAEQIWDWLYRKRARSFSEMSNVNKECLALLEENFALGTIDLQLKQVAKDGTVKFLFRLRDGNLIETVLMRQAYGLSVCVTTQVGCNIGCSFCASGLLRKVRNLEAAEIVEQLMQVQFFLDEAGKGERVSHVVVMGIGEPFDNFDNMIRFVKVINHPKGLAIGARHITVSTSGIVPKIYEFADLDLQVNLAISLHAPNNELRSSIMKINRAYPIEKIMEAMDYYLKKTNRRVTIEYILLKDVNDHVEEARQLAELLKDKRKLVYVNLIPYNPVFETPYQRSTKEAMLAFYDTLKKNGINCVIRKEHGTDIDAACGQLRSKQLKKAN